MFQNQELSSNRCQNVSALFIAETARKNYFFLPHAFFLFRKISSVPAVTFAGTTSAFNYNCHDRHVFLQKWIWLRAWHVNARINKLLRASVMRPAFSTRSGLIPSNVPRTARHVIGNKTSPMAREHFSYTHQPDIFMGCTPGFMARAS